MSAHPARAAGPEVTLLDVLDSALDTGVVLQGDATISVADVDLVFLGLKLVLASVETMEGWRRSAGEADYTTVGRDCPDPSPAAPTGMADQQPPFCGVRELAPAFPGGGLPPPLSPSPKDPDQIEQGLAKLVLTVVELLRRLLERQALRRMEGGSLSPQEIERMGQVFHRLEIKMEELKRVFGLEAEELNLNLGPLGNLT